MRTCTTASLGDNIALQSYVVRERMREPVALALSWQLLRASKYLNSAVRLRTGRRQ